jgi:hypothetical protein
MGWSDRYLNVSERRDPKYESRTTQLGTETGAREQEQHADQLYMVNC